MPKETRFNTQITNNADQLQISNNGNASIVVEGLRLCEIGSESCTSPATQQLRPGGKLSKPLSAGQLWKYTLVEDQQKKAMTAGR
jgi:hypothetical protein